MRDERPFVPLHLPQAMFSGLKLLFWKQTLFFSFWSFEINKGILRNQKVVIGLDSFSNQRLRYLLFFFILLVFVSTTLLKVAKLQ